LSVQNIDQMDELAGCKWLIRAKHRG
jgi:hypothetical protein